MELIDRKRINNLPTGVSVLSDIEPLEPNFRLPTDIRTPEKDILAKGVPVKKGIDVNKVAGIAQNVGNVINFGSQLLQGGQYGRSLEDLNVLAGQSNGSIGGINYSIQNEVNAADEMSRVKSENTANTIGAIGTGASTGASIGSSFGPVGTGIGAAAGAILGGIGGLFGDSKRSAAARRAIRLQQFKALANNSFNRSDAASSALQLDYLQENGNQEDQLLFQYKYGKQPVISANGKINATPNAFVSKGEWIVDTVGGSLQYVDHGPNDTAKAKIKNTDAVISNNIKNPYTGNSLAEDVPAYAAAGLLGQLLNIQGDMLKRNINKFKYGKMPKYKLGTPEQVGIHELNPWTIIAPRTLGMLNSAIGLYKNNRQAVPYKNNYMPNTMANRALNRLAGLRIDQQPIMNDINDQYRQLLYGIRNSGGLSSSQRQLQTLAAGLGTQRNRANALSSIQQQNNQYRSALSSAEMQHGAQEASNIMSSRNAADDMYYRALAAKRQMGRTYETDLYNNYQKMFADWNNMRMQNDMLGLYQLKINNDIHKLTGK